MNIVIGKIVNTFGIKGELKIVSNFEMANRALKKGNRIIINNLLLRNLNFLTLIKRIFNITNSLIINFL